jgi:CelD/BcsL family acetyltransferase involved in cellulose biosynthesis
VAQTQSDLHIVRYTDASAFSFLRPLWNSLLNSTPVDDPFLTWEWQSSWWKHNNQGWQLWLLSAWKGERLVGILPLALTEKNKWGVNARFLYFLGGGANDHSGIIIASKSDDVAQAFGKYLAAHDNEWDILQLNNFQKGCQNLDPFLGGFSKNKFIPEISDETSHLYLPLRGKWEDIEKKLPERTRRLVKNRTQFILSEMGGRIVYLTGKQITASDFEDFLNIALLGKHSYLYETEKDRQFHRSLLTSMGPKGWIQLTLFYLKDHPIAYIYGFIYRNKYFDWRTGYDPQFSRLSVGTILLSKNIEHNLKEGLDEYDFLRGDYKSKQTWTSCSRTYMNFRIIRRWRLPGLIFIRLPGWKEWLINCFMNRDENNANPSPEA